MKNRMLSTPSRTAEQLIRDLQDARQRELELIAGLTGSQLLGPRLKSIEPPIWELGHVGWFQERWILRNLDGAPPVRPDADALYDSFKIPNSARWDLHFPGLEETQAYIDEVLRRTVRRLEGREPSPGEVYFYRLAIFHEDMHGETLMRIRQTLAYPAPQLPTSSVNQAALEIDPDYEPYDVRIPGGVYQLGATPDLPFVFDNEKWSHPVQLEEFRISSTPVTNFEYQAFVAAGGYRERSLWSDEGWEWVTQSGLDHPVYWSRQSDGGWLRRYFDSDRPLKLYDPVVHVNWYEANAYCAWAGRRLPTEAEWELAASGEPTGRGFGEVKRWFPWGNEPPTPARANLDAWFGDCVDVRGFPAGDSAFGVRQMIGNIWEWTADTFNPYPGFEIDPYDTYSAPSFGQQKVLRGGSWATRARLIRNTWRNFYTPDRNDVFAGFRTCAP